MPLLKEDKLLALMTEEANRIAQSGVAHTSESVESIDYKRSKPDSSVVIPVKYELGGEAKSLRYTDVAE